jgi:alginate O-acetyltransferase complex protein AlgI
MAALVFSSILFLFAYLPAVLAAYHIAPKSWRNPFLFFVSLIFYAWGEPVYVLLMVFTAAFGWLTGLMLERWGGHSGKAKGIIALSAAVNLGILGFFKYGDFILGNINQLTGWGLALLNLPLPLGISFYTFQTMSYTIDVYRRQAPVQHNFLSFGAYVALFPQLIAGPIVRYNTIARQLDHRRERLDLFGRGTGLFATGLAKKVLLANNIGLFWDGLKALPSGEMTVLAAWCGIVAFGLQLYFDFSGYSDMAIGLGWMLGFHFERNFRYPYISRSVTEFWRRWHISLGEWFREYLYIPLGGSRVGTARTIFNLFVVWVATGFWHGASWNYVLWGLYYFVFLIGEKFLWGGLLEKIPRLLRHAYTLFIVMAGWALFVFEDMGSLGLFARALAGQAAGGWVNQRLLYYLNSWSVVLLAAILGATPLAKTAYDRLAARRPGLTALLKPALMLSAMLLSAAYLVDSSYNPFLYFRF